MSTNSVTPIDMPREFHPHELFFSLTDPKGRILGGNSVFTRISGYAEAELVGKPHNIIRHPDMPRCVFQLLWDYLLAGKTIAAYVKNLAADGRYYWVLALVTPCRDGFLSVRLKPSTGLFDAARSVYRETLEFERRIESQSGKREAIKQSTGFLLEKLADAGFSGYEDFMLAALSEELAAREGLADNAACEAGEGFGGAPCLSDLRSRSQSVVAHLGEVYASLGLFQSLSDQLAERHKSLEDLSPSLGFLALNANLSASRLGSDGATLAVISRDLRDRSNSADGLLSGLMDRMASLRDNARRVAFDVAVAQLEAQVCEAFSSEILADGGIDSHCVDVGLGPLNEELKARCHTVLDTLGALLTDVESLRESASRLVEQVARMKIIQINGRIEIASLRGAENFHSIFDDVARIVATACEDCSAVISLLTSTRERVDRLLGVDHQLRVDLDGVSDAVVGVLSTRGEAQPV